MSRPIVALISIFLFCVSASAQGQTTPNASLAQGCPTLTITGPAAITTAGELMEWTAEISGEPPTASYHWTLGDEGVIEGGQGTLRLRVRAPKKKLFRYCRNPGDKGSSSWMCR